MQLVDALKTPWKQFIREQNKNLNGLLVYTATILLKKNPLRKHNSKELYNILI